MSGPLDQKTGNDTREFFRNPTEAGWEHFVKRYGPKIHDWCRRDLRLAPALVEDVAATVVGSLFEKMELGRPHWDPAKGHLHAWLRTVVHNACRDALERHRPTVELHESDRACADFADQLARDEVLRLARDRTQARVKEKAWEAFRLLKLDGLTAEQVSAQTGLGVGTVYNYASKVRQLFEEELNDLGGVGLP
jgi:RNA polymerase sigma factor (sigma-70 family)